MTSFYFFYKEFISSKESKYENNCEHLKKPGPICPRFHKWFYKKRGSIFEKSVIKSTKVKITTKPLYNNGIKSQYFHKMHEQFYKIGDSNFTENSNSPTG